MNRFSIANPPDHIVFLANELRRVDQRTYRGFIDLYREEMEEDPNLMTIEVSGPWYSVSLTTGAVSIIERGDHLGDLEIDVLSRLKDAGFDLSDECLFPTLYPTWTAYRDEAQRVGHLLQGRGEYTRAASWMYAALRYANNVTESCPVPSVEDLRILDDIRKAWLSLDKHCY